MDKKAQAFTGKLDQANTSVLFLNAFYYLPTGRKTAKIRSKS